MTSHGGIDASSRGPVATAVAAGELPERVWLYSNYNCNLSCSYCLTESSPSSSRRELSAEQMHTVAVEAAALGFRALGVTGGEPFLIPWMTETVIAMSALLPVVVNTNGTLFAGDRLARVARIAGHDVSLQISLDSEDPEINDGARGPGNFAKVMDAVPRLIDAGVRVRIATTTTGQLDDPTLDPLRALVASLGVHSSDHVIRPMVRRGRADGRAIGVQAGARDIPCELTITAEGAFWGSFGPTVVNGKMDTDMLVTRTIQPLSIPANALLAAIRGTTMGGGGLGIVCA